MGLLSLLFNRSRAASTPAESPADAVQRARAQARRRLIGAVVLVGAGIVGFPLLFETQPRPIPVDLPIVIPKKDAAPPLTPASPRATPLPAKVGDDAAAEPGAQSPAAAPPAEPPQAPEPRPEAKSPVRSDADAERARTLLEGKSPAAAASQRLIVQVGAFADPAAVRGVRQRVEQVGLKTYVQEVQTDAGKRVRVRVGPFDSRDDAEKAAARIKAAGLPAAVMTP